MRTSSKLLVGLAAFGALIASVVACSEDTAAPPTDFGPLLRNITEGTILPAHEAFVTSADALALALDDLAASPSPDAAKLTATQAAWRDARAKLRRLDALHFGPIADLGITERIDITVRPEDIEALLAGTAPIDDASVTAAGGHAKGFLGLQYSLFSTTGNDSVLTALSGDGVSARRRALLAATGHEIASAAHQLGDAWAKDKGGYANEIINAGSGSQRYASQRAAMDELVGGVAYALELVVGIRLAEPLGRKSGGTANPSLDPTGASDNTVADLEASLSGVHALYDANGLSSRVRTKSTPLDDRFVSQLGDCDAKVQAIPAPYATALTSNVVVVQAAYDACKAAKGTWNTDVTSALGATLKPSDNDGD